MINFDDGHETVVSSCGQNHALRDVDGNRQRSKENLCRLTVSSNDGVLRA